MANDLFGGLGGLMKGLSGFMSQDDPDVRLMSVQSDLSVLQKQETEIYADIGRQSLAQSKGRFPELENRLILSERFEGMSPEWQKEHEKAFERAQNEAQRHFHRCHGCHQWVCDSCYNEDETLCTDCAPPTGGGGG